MTTYLTTLKKIHERRNIYYAVIDDIVRNAMFSKLTFLETEQKKVIVLKTNYLQDSQRSLSAFKTQTCTQWFR